MTNYSRQFGANISDIKAIRLIESAAIAAISYYYVSDVVNQPLTLSDSTRLHSFMQLNGSGQLSYSQELTAAGTVYTYKLSWAYPRSRKEVNALLEAIKSNYFVIAVADGNLDYMLLGTPAAPFEVVASFSAGDGAYSFQAIASTLTPPQFISGIFNPQLYVGGTGTV